MKLIAFDASSLELPLPAGRIVVGGEARLALWCYLNGKEWPEEYTPRDYDYLVITYKKSNPSRGIPKRGETDFIKAPSVIHYFRNIDLLTNQVAVYKQKIVTTTDCVRCFRNGTLLVNPNNKKLALKGQSYFLFLLMRACIQTGFSIEKKEYLPRVGALKLPVAYEKEALRVSKKHWYWERYWHKMLQIATGAH